MDKVFTKEFIAEAAREYAEVELVRYSETHAHADERLKQHEFLNCKDSFKDGAGWAIDEIKDNVVPKQALRDAIALIRLWHGMGHQPAEEKSLWKIYSEQSPEMKRLNEYLK